MAESASYAFVANYSTHLYRAITEAGFTARNPNLDAANFPALEYGRKRLRGELIEIPELAAPEFPFALVGARRLRAAEIREVISFVVAFPHLVANAKIAALGVLWHDANDRRGIPVAHCIEGARRIELHWLGGWWGKRYRVLGIHTSDTTPG